MMVKSTAAVLAASVASGAAAALTVSGNAQVVAGAIVSTIGLVVAVIGWVDKRIEHKLSNYAQVQNARHETLVARVEGKLELLTNLLKAK